MEQNPLYTPGNYTPNRNLSVGSSSASVGPLMAPLSFTAPYMNMNTANSTPQTLGGSSTPAQQTNYGLNLTATGTQTGQTQQNQAGSQTGQTQQNQTGTQTGQTQTTGQTGGGTPAGQTSSTGASSTKGSLVQNAVNSGMGPGMFAYQAMARGSDYLKTLPGFENLPDEALAGAPTFAGRMQEVENATRKAYRLDELLGQFTSMVQEGSGLKTNLTDYIRGRDEFINETDSLLTKFKTNLMNSKDVVSDPAAIDRNNQYTTYLYELRGRQNKRYIEVLNGAVDEYSGRVEAMSTLYNNALDGYTRELTQKQAITQEEYNLMYGALSDMYTTTANAPMVAMQMAQMQAQTNAAIASAAADAAKLASYGDQGYADTREAYSKNGVIDQYSRWKPTSFAADQLLTGGDPKNIYRLIIDSADSTFGKTQNDKGEDVSLSTAEQIAAGKNMLGYIGALGQNGVLDQEEYASGTNEILTKLSKSVAGSLSTVGQDKIVGMADDFVNGDYSWWGFTDRPTRTQVLKTWGSNSDNKIGDEYVNAAYDSLEQSIKDGGTADEWLKDFKDQSKGTVYSKLSDAYLAKVFSE
jgi:hypothetical protein